MHKHTFTDEEIDYARSLARLRNDNKKENGIKSGKVSDEQTDEEIHRIGILGELATARTLDSKVNQEIDPSGDDGKDLIIGPVSAEVKTREGKEKDFAMFDATSDFEADLGILCWRTGQREITIVGWLTFSEWLLLAQPLRFGRTIRRGVPWDNMREIQSLRTLLNRYQENHDE